ncbi:Eco57I restriction-modification methylase domain-containing protein [candidate division KSB1 bacterium]|nr:Eco57I restriction-modification methylase domain-containing protein [candidate division KSB1 bacterium]
MTKAQLQEILSAPFDLNNWRNALAEIFNVKHFHRQPQPIILPSNDKAENAYELGSFETKDDRLIGLYQVNVLPGVMLERNKVGLRGLLRNVYKYDVDGALIVFVQSDNWRFSYVSEIRTLDEKGYVTQSITNPKRFTYFFGPGESCRTAVERFQLLSDNGQIHLKDIQEAFSVEKISKQFFKEYKEHYSKFVDYLDGSKYKITAFNNNEKAIRNFCKKLLGRIVFLYFLQKKGWLGVPVDGRWGEGDRAFLKNLFLSTGANQSFYAAALTTLFFDTLNTIRENDICELIDGKPCRIPYLNGGLFEKESDKYDFLTFPPQLFTDLFAFFDSYNFTIYEDSPEEHTMAVDPEMLGHIFENLLEDNKDKGAYYTPKEIVHYMTQESLIEYLFTHCQNSDLPDLMMDRIVIENLVKNKEATGISKLQADHLDRLLDAVKICDPAIGSGAFPMGLLHEIYSAKQVLHTCTPNAPEWEPAKVKENIIQNSIYGVDIEKGAVDIARLRFWLSLIVDEETPRPLPNLEYKIVVGNSLVPKFEDEVIEIDWDLKSSVGKADEYVQKIQALLKQIVSKQRAYFNPGGNKQKQKQEIRDLKIELLITQLTLNKYRYQAKNPLSSSFAPTAKDRQKDLEIKTTLAGFDRNIARLKALQGNDKPFEHFDWKLDFPEILNENVTKEIGFNIVIANPPYLKVQHIPKDLIDFFNSRYNSTKGKYDIYVIFIEKSFSLIKKSGCIVFINPHRFLFADYGKSLRNIILNSTALNKLIYFGVDQIFETATSYTGIFVFKNENTNLLFAKPKNKSLENIDFTEIPYFLLQKNWLLTDDIFAIKILEKIYLIPILIFQRCISGCNYCW